MPLYELVLRRDGDEEVRLTDKLPRIGVVITVAGREWRVDSAETPGDPNAVRRYVCVPAEDGR